MSLPRISLGETLAVGFLGLLAELRFAGEILTSLIGLFAAAILIEVPPGVRAMHGERGASAPACS